MSKNHYLDTEDLVTDAKVVLEDVEAILDEAANATGERAQALRARAAEALGRAKHRLQDAQTAVANNTKAAAAPPTTSSRASLGRHRHRCRRRFPRRPARRPPLRRGRRGFVDRRPAPPPGGAGHAAAVPRRVRLARTGRGALALPALDRARAARRGAGPARVDRDLGPAHRCALAALRLGHAGRAGAGVLLLAAWVFRTLAVEHAAAPPLLSETLRELASDRDAVFAARARRDEGGEA